MSTLNNTKQQKSKTKPDKNSGQIVDNFTKSEDDTTKDTPYNNKKERTTRKLTPKEQAFLDRRKRFPKESGTQSALEVYDTDDRATASAIAYENLAKPHILHELNKWNTTLQERLIDLTVVTPDMTANQKKVALEAINSALDRLHGKPVNRGITGNVDNVESLLTD